jgi:hypothetical protein
MQEQTMKLDDFLVRFDREALLQCEQIPLSSPVFDEARKREKSRQARVKDSEDTSLKQSLRRIILNPDIKGFDKKRDIVDLIQK